ncbi:MAG: RidA family protein [Planctomycetes bacterium]|nr:RidA family protein [Planctomycetota bacterium]
MSRKFPVNPAELCAPVGFAHGWLVEGGDTRTLYLAGQCGYDREGRIVHPGDLVAQMELAMRNIGYVLRDAGMEYADLVQLNFYVLSRDDYTVARREFGATWKRLCGRHYPGMALFMVAGLFDPQARIEIQGIAAR